MGRFMWVDGEPLFGVSRKRGEGVRGGEEERRRR